MTPEEIQQVVDEINQFKQKSIDLANKAPALSAHYWRLYQVSSRSQKRFDRMKRTAERLDATTKRKAVRQGSSTTPTAAKQGKAS